MSLRDSLTEQTVATLPLPDPVETSSKALVRDAIVAMQEAGTGCIVITEHCRPIGVFTDRDLLTKVLGEGLSDETAIIDVMTREPATIGESESIASVIGLMHSGGFRHIPVVDASGHLKNVISVKRIVEYLVEHFPQAVFNLPPDPGQRQMAREGA